MSFNCIHKNSIYLGTTQQSPNIKICWEIALKSSTNINICWNLWNTHFHLVLLNGKVLSKQSICQSSKSYFHAWGVNRYSIKTAWNTSDLPVMSGTDTHTHTKKKIFLTFWSCPSQKKTFFFTITQIQIGSPFTSFSTMLSSPEKDLFYKESNTHRSFICRTWENVDHQLLISSI